jgi:hypothetical protein
MEQQQQDQMQQAGERRLQQAKAQVQVAQQQEPPSLLHEPGQLPPADLALAGQLSPYTARYRASLDPDGFPDLQISYDEAMTAAEAAEQALSDRLLDLLQNPGQVTDEQVMALLSSCEPGRAWLELMLTQPRYALAPSDDDSAPSSPREGEASEQQQQQGGGVEVGEMGEGQAAGAGSEQQSSAAGPAGVAWVDALLACGLLGPWDSSQRQQLRNTQGNACDSLEGESPAGSSPPPAGAAAAAITPGRSITFESLQQDVASQLQLLEEQEREAVLATGVLANIQEAGDSSSSSSSRCWQANVAPTDASGPLQANWAAAAVLASLQANCGPAAGAAAQGLQANLPGAQGGPMSPWVAPGGGTQDSSVVESDAGGFSAAVQTTDWPAAWLADTSAPGAGAPAAATAAAPAAKVGVATSSASAAPQRPLVAWVPRRLQQHVTCRPPKAAAGPPSAGGPTVTRQDLLLLRAALGQLLQVAATALQAPAEQLLRAGLCCHQGSSSAAAGTGGMVLPATAWQPSKEAADALQVKVAGLLRVCE